ncbi:mucin-13b isoform X1 [Poecilia latipinna]|uniref:mucin-13b isoform X1 n=1 Tax=Poecilia latipinna TaxID=48699 RepID=UPI00072EA1EB|nr:PREDICTED: mucin-13-like isoform X1 [Poecilia latipinna]
MAKTLIVTFLLCVAVATVAATTTNSPPTTTPLPTTTKTTTTTTKAPTTTITSTTTTKAPTTTITPTTTTKAPTPAPSSTTTPPTGTPPTEGSSVSPNTGSSQTNAPSTAPVTEPPKPSSACASNPCGGGSTCEERFDETFTCLCLPGDVYQGDCQRAKVFPGLLQLGTPYDEKMADKTSQIFNETAKRIIEEIDGQFTGAKNGYIRAIVLELREQNANARAQRQSGNVEASVEIIYEPTAEITQETVTETMKDVACTGCALEGTFIVKNLCDSNPCDTSSSKCSSAEGTFQCTCGDGFIDTDYTDRLCLACPSGQKPVNNECINCGFGLTGFNCKDNTLLIVVIVCCILGALVIATLIALPLVAKKSKKKSSKRNEEDIGKPYQSHSVAKAPLSYSNGNSNDFSASVKEPTNSLANSGAPRIPRATANSNWESRTNLEMTPSNSRQNLIPSRMNSRFNNNQDDMYSFSQNRPKNHAYEEMQPKSNPYSQNRASNPYAQTRGQTNPYFN